MGGPRLFSRFLGAFLVFAMCFAALTIGGPATAQAQEDAECDYNVLIVHNCFILTGSLLAGDAPLSGYIVAAYPFPDFAATTADGSFAVPVVFIDGDSFVLEIVDPLNPGLLSLELSIALPTATSGTVFHLPPVQLPEIIPLEIVVETNCGDNVPLGGCELVDIPLSAERTGDIADIVDLSAISAVTEIHAFQGTYADTSLPFAGTGTVPVFAGTEGETIDITPVSSTDSISVTRPVWDGSNPFIVRIPDIQGSPLPAAGGIVGDRPVYFPASPTTAADQVLTVAAAPAAPIPAAPPLALAHTGATTTDLAAMGLLLISAGCSITLGVRRRRRTHG